MVSDFGNTTYQTQNRTSFMDVPILTWKSSSILVTQSDFKLWKIAFPENQDDEELIDVEMQEENYYSDITTLKEPYNPEVGTTSETGT